MLLAHGGNRFLGGMKHFGLGKSRYFLFKNVSFKMNEFFMFSSIFIVKKRENI